VNCDLLSIDFRFYTREIERTDEGLIELGHDNTLGDEARGHQSGETDSDSKVASPKRPGADTHNH
jgi:hypothetical protein